jgi:hypothetical protein
MSREACLLNKISHLVADFGVTKFIRIIDVNWVTLGYSTMCQILTFYGSVHLTKVFIVDECPPR